MMQNEERKFYVYILANKTNNVLYTGVTNNLIRRIFEHREKQSPGFTNKYNISKLVYFETHDTFDQAVNREKKIKGGSRTRKINLIGTFNHDWKDLYGTIIS